MKVLFTIIQADLTKVCHTSAWTGCQQVAFFAMSIERNYKVIYVRNCVRYIQPLIVKLLLYHFSHCLKIINEMLDLAINPPILMYLRTKLSMVRNLYLQCVFVNRFKTFLKANVYLLVKQ